MTETMMEALRITGLGSAILFGTLACLVGVMYLLTTLLRERSPAVPEALESVPPVGQAVRPTTAKVAAIAVALARAEAEAASAQTGRVEVPQSAGGWWAFHLHRQLLSHIHTRRTTSR